jgi:post-segregation antitoxin (ccd killing protein)
MDRKNITIRKDQSEWVDEAGVNLSRFVQEAIDERMEPTETELAEAYKENTGHAAETNNMWSDVSTEANEQLGDHPAQE